MRFRISAPAIGPQMEKAIRPFAERRPEWRIGAPNPPQDEDEPVLEWAARTSVETLTLQGIGFQVITGADEVEEEVSREVREERVEQEGNPENFVDVEVIEEIVFRDPVTGRLRRYVLNN